ncbi:MAG: hypothetical protein ACR2Q3_01600 [Woeseiaceae bacterium]
MTHKAETILDAVVTAVTGLASTGSNVERGRAYAVSAVPSLSVFMGEDQIENELSIGYYDRVLEVFVEAHVATTGDTEQDLNQIRAEVFAALRADHTLGGAAIEIKPDTESRPEIQGETDTPHALQQLLYLVKYRHSTTSAEV